jgi:hypothetical protein
MIGIVGIVAAVLAVWLGTPLLVDPIRKAFRRREEARQRQQAEQEETRRRLQAEQGAARKRQQAEQERIKQAQAVKQREHERLWCEEPDRAALPEWLNFRHAVQLPLQHAAAEAGRVYERWREHTEQRQSEHRDGKPVTAAYKVIVFGGLAAFIFAGLLGIALDYLIFRGLHPTGTVILPAALACLAVLGITVGSVVFMSAWRHGLLASSTIPYIRRVVTLGGVILAAGVALYVTMIAPYRSAPAGEANIGHWQAILRQDQTTRPPLPGYVINYDKQQVAKAKTDLAHAQLVDRLSAAALAFMEIPLSAGAVLGSGLLALGLAKQRREQARRDKQRADDNLDRAEARFSAALTQILVAHGHAEEVFAGIRARLERLADPGNAAPPSGWSAPGQNGSQPPPPPTAAGMAGPGPSAGGNANGGPAAPGMAGPGPSAGGNANGSPAASAAPPSTGPAAAEPGQVPTINLIGPVGGPVGPQAAPQAPVNTNGPAATVSPADLSPIELDATA